MLTHTGINMLPGEDAAPRPLDLAVQMGRICQFGGSVWFTLLAHSVLVAEFVAVEMKLDEDPDNEAGLETWAWALLHDAHEIATSDVPRGWKTDDMRAHQKELDRRIQHRYGIDEDLVNFELIKKIDHRACEVQAHNLNLCRYTEISSSKPPIGREHYIFNVIQKGPLTDPVQCLSASSPAIGLMEMAFWFIEKGQKADAYSVVRRIVRHGEFAWR